jgi:hypothetical protein
MLHHLYGSFLALSGASNKVRHVYIGVIPEFNVA